MSSVLVSTNSKENVKLLGVCWLAANIANFKKRKRRHCIESDILLNRCSCFWTASLMLTLRVVTLKTGLTSARSELLIFCASYPNFHLWYAPGSILQRRKRSLGDASEVSPAVAIATPQGPSLCFHLSVDVSLSLSITINSVNRVASRVSVLASWQQEDDLPTTPPKKKTSRGAKRSENWRDLFLFFNPL